MWKFRGTSFARNPRHWLVLLALLFTLIPRIAGGLTLVSVTYQGGKAVLQDNGDFYPPGGAPNWSQSVNWPVLFYKGQPAGGAHVVATHPATPGNFYLKIKGEAPDGIVYASGAQWISQQDDPFPVYFDSAATGTFPTQKTYHDFQISWKKATSPDGDDWSTWSDFGTSSTMVYVSFAEARPDVPLYRTIMHNACIVGGASSAASAVAVTWQRFQGKAFKTWNGQTLYYYQSGTTFGQNPVLVEGLLPTKRGQCGAWASIFNACLGVHGISAPIKMVRRSNDNEPLCVIKNWQEDNAGTQPDPYRWRIWMSSVNGSPDMVPPPFGNSDFGDLTNLAGVAGQGLQTPSQKTFSIHYLVQYGSIFYDPSYGIAYTSPNSMESLSVHGFAENLASWGFDGNLFYFDVRGSSSGGLIFVDPF